MKRREQTMYRAEGWYWMIVLILAIGYATFNIGKHIINEHVKRECSVRAWVSADETHDLRAAGAVYKRCIENRIWP